MSGFKMEKKNVFHFKFSIDTTRGSHCGPGRLKPRQAIAGSIREFPGQPKCTVQNFG
jgi:hypothetical protein